MDSVWPPGSGKDAHFWRKASRYSLRIASDQSTTADDVVSVLTPRENDIIAQAPGRLLALFEVEEPQEHW